MLTLDAGEEILALELPSLEVQDLKLEDQNSMIAHYDFPSWMLPSPSSKLVTPYVLSGLPQIAELWVSHPDNLEALSARAPTLACLRYCYNYEDEYEDEDILSLLRARRENVEVQVEVNGIKMQTLKRLEISFKDSRFKILEEIKLLVDQMVDSDLNARIWEMEI